MGDKVFSLYKAKKLKNQEREERKRERQKIQKTQKLSQKPTEKIKEIQSEKLPSEYGEQIREIIKRAQINISRGYFESARSLIIEWLALKKDNKDLNQLLADVYEREKKFQNAEFIYRDLLDSYPDDSYLLQRLWNIYVLREKTSRAFEVYKQAHQHEKSNTEILDILSHLSLELGDYKSAVKYAGLYLKEKPRVAEKLGIKWYWLEKLGRKKEALEAYSQVLQLQPYNSEVQERVEKLS